MRPNKQGKCILLALAVLCFFTACAPARDKKAPAIAYNASRADTYWHEQYVVEYNPQAQAFTLRDNAAKSSMHLIRSPFEWGENYYATLLGAGEDVYVLKQVSLAEENRRYNDIDKRITLTLEKVNLQSLRVNTVFETVYTVPGDGSVDSKWGFLSNLQIEQFFVSDTYLFIICVDDTVRQIHRVTQQIELLPVAVKGNIAFDGQNILFLNGDSLLVQYDIQSKTCTPLSDVAAMDFFLYKNDVYFLNRKDDNALYKYSREDGHIQKINATPASILWVENDQIYFWSLSEAAYYQVDLDGNQATLMPVKSEQEA